MDMLMADNSFVTLLYDDDLQMITYDDAKGVSGVIQNQHKLIGSDRSDGKQGRDLWELRET